MILGAHMSIAGGVHRALERGATVGCDAVQIFTRNQLQHRAPELDPDHAALFRRLAEGYCSKAPGGPPRLVAHASYLINLASDRPGLWRRSVEGLAEDLRRCMILGIEALVLHPGAHGGAGAVAGARRVKQGAQAAYGAAGSPCVKLLLETSAGHGTALGGSFEELRDLLGEVAAAGVPCGVCLDTCHVFAAGYELRTPEGYRDTWELFDSRIGRERLGVIHLNDSRHPRGFRSDRHEHIGQGWIGAEGFRRLVNDPRLETLGGILETPKGRRMEEDKRNLETLRGLLAPAGPGLPEPRDPDREAHEALPLGEGRDRRDEPDGGSHLGE